MTVQTRLKAGFLVPLKGTSRHGYDGDSPAGLLLKFNPNFSSLEAIHLRHLHVHQYEIKICG
jgi:hypothetical protein